MSRLPEPIVADPSPAAPPAGLNVSCKEPAASADPVHAGRWFSRRFTSTWRGGLALLFLCLAVYVPGQASIPPVDRDESRFAQASRQMVESGNWVVPHIQDRPRLNKPPLIYWAQGAAVALLGDRGRPHEGIWVYRLPSLLAAIATVFLTWRLGLSMFDPRAAWLGATMLAVAPLFAWEAHQARADQLLVTTVIATQFALWRLWRRSTSTPPHGLLPIPHCLLLWLPLSLGIMTKGPITPMIAALTALALCITTRRWRWLLSLRPLLGLAIIAVVVAPWVYLVGERVGWSHYLQTIYNETLGRAGAPKEGHWGPPGYHLVVLTVLFWPGTLLTAAAVVAAVRQAINFPARTDSSSVFSRLRRRSPGRHPELFLIAWLLPTWLVFELVSTKLPHYTMPLYPAVALLSARAVLGAAANPKPRSLGDRVGLGAWLLIGAVMVVAIGLAAAKFIFDQGIPELVAAAASIAAVAGAVALVIAARTRLIVRTQVCGVIVAAIGMAAACGVVLPTLSGLWFSPAFARAIREADPDETRPIALVLYHEDSMLFHTRGRAQRINSDAVPAWMAEHPDGLLVMPTDDVPLNYRQILSKMGLNYSTGDMLDLSLVERSPW